MDEVIDYNLKAKVIFTVSDFTQRLNNEELNEDMCRKLFSIGTTEWSIFLSKDDEDEDELKVYIGLEKSLQNSVEIDLNIHVKDIYNKRFINNVGLVEYKKKETNWWPIKLFTNNWSENKLLGFKLANQILEDPNQFLVNDCLIIYVDIKVLDEFKLHNNQNYNFETVLNNQLLNEFKLIVKGKEFFVSKEILSSRSPVFQAMLCNESQCVIDDIDVDVFEELLNFIDSGKLSKIETMTVKLLEISDRFQVKELVTICEQLLIFDLDINNALNSLIIADKHNCMELKTKALKYIVINKSKFPANDFLNLIKNYNQLAYEMIGENVCKKCRHSESFHFQFVIIMD